MKRFIVCISLFLIFFTSASFVFAQDLDIMSREEYSTINDISLSLSQMTGMAINPLLVTTVFGIYKNIKAKPHEQIPWYYSSKFLILCGLLSTISLFLSFGNIFNLPPQISSFVEQLNKIIGLAITTPIVLNIISPISTMLTNNIQSALITNDIYIYASIISVEFFETLPGVIWNIITTLIMFFIYVATWLVNFSFDTLIFLCPFGWIDSILKSIRATYFVLLVILTAIFPPLALIITIPVIVIAIILFGKSVRNLIMGLVLLKDFIIKKRETIINDKGIIAFSQKGLGITAKHMCRLTKKDNKFIFEYKKLFISKRVITVDNYDSVLKIGFINMTIYNNGKLICVLPPRYKELSMQIQTYLNINKIEENKIMKGIKGIIVWVKNIFSQNKTVELA